MIRVDFCFLLEILSFLTRPPLAPSFFLNLFQIVTHSFAILLFSPSLSTMKFIFAATLLLPALCEAKVYFKDSFTSPHSARWTVTSEKPSSELGAWKTKQGKFSEKSDQSLFTTEDARHYGLSAKLDEPISNEGKDLVIQYVVRNEQEVRNKYVFMHFAALTLTQSINFLAETRILTLYFYVTFISMTLIPPPSSSTAAERTSSCSVPPHLPLMPPPSVVPLPTA